MGLTRLERMALERASKLSEKAFSTAIRIAGEEGRGECKPLMVDISRTDSIAYQLNYQLNESRKWIDAVLENNK